MAAEIEKEVQEVLKCGTRPIKNIQHKVKTGKDFIKADIQPAITDPLFNATLHLANPKFTWPNGQYQNSGGNVQTLFSYMINAAKPMVAYCSQYGSCSLKIDTTVLNGGTFALSGNKTYDDAQLQAYIDDFCSTNNIPKGDCVAFFNPFKAIGIENSTAPISQRIMGYHSVTPNGNYYVFVNFNNANTPLTLLDQYQQYAQTFSHEIQEMLVDPLANSVNPEVCDPCAGNCLTEVCNYFDANGNYVGSGGLGSFGSNCAFYTAAVCTPAQVLNCPPTDFPASCTYAPPSPPPPNSSVLLQQGLLDWINGFNTGDAARQAKGIDEIKQGILATVAGQ